MTEISSAASRSRLPNTAEAGRASESARDELTLDLFAGLSEPAANGGEPAIAVASASIGEPIASASNAPANESEIEGVARGGDMPDIQRAETSSAVSTSASAAGSAAARSMKPRASKRRAQRRTIAEDVVKETEEVDAADAAPSAPVHIERPQDSTPEPQPAAAAQSAEAPAESVPPPVLDIPPPRDTTSDPLSLATFPGAGHMAADTPYPSALAEAARVIAADPERAADTYIRVNGSKIDRALLLKILRNPQVQFKTAPQNTFGLAQFMYRVGAIRNEPKSWRDYFFDDPATSGGS